MVVVIDVGEVAQIRRGQFFLHAQEPHPPRCGAEPGEAVGEQRSVRAADWPDLHRRSVTEYDHPALGGTDRPPAEQAVHVLLGQFGVHRRSSATSMLMSFFA